MLQEQDTCRICSGPGEDEQPLFYPCKCSGTIRYIHQDCLKTWLDHSKKSTCDVCKYPYTFTKVYAPDMPERIPAAILIRKFAEQLVNVVLFMFRATLVAFTWLTVLPYGTVLTWRLYFRMGDVIAWGISLHSRPAILNTSLHAVRNDTPSAISDVSFQPYLRTLSADIFTGQIITSLIVLAFLAVFLLREWIQQNALPGVFDDAPAGEGEVQQPDPQPGEGQAENDHDLVVEAPGGEADPDVAPGFPAPPATDHQVVPPHRPAPDVPEDVQPATPASPSSSSSSTIEDPSERPSYARSVEQPLPSFGRRRRMKAHDISRRRTHRATAADVSSQHDIRRRRRPLEGESSSVNVDIPSDAREREKVESSHRDAQYHEASGVQKSGGLYALEGGPNKGNYTAEQSGSGSDNRYGPGSKSGQKRKAEDIESDLIDRQGTAPTERSLSPSSPWFEFTFHLPQSSPPQSSAFPQQFPLPENNDLNLSSSPTASVSSHHIPEPLSEASSSHSKATRLGSPLFELPPPPESRGSELPYPLTPRTSAPSSTSQLPLPGQSDPVSASSSRFAFTSSPPISARLSQPLRRPPLPTSTIPPAEHANAEASTSAVTTDTMAALPSPHLAIYRPPEELDVDDSEYFSGGARDHTPPPDVEQGGDEEVEDEDEVGEDEDGEGEEGEDEGEDEEGEEDEDEARFEYYFREPDPEDTKEVPPPLLLPDTDDDDDDEDEDEEEQEDEADARDAEERRDFEPQGDADALPAARDAPGAEAAAAEIVDEERDQNLEEDLDGAMEAVGLRGPVSAILQNAALMLFILNVSIGGAVWIPFTLGKTVALLTLEPRRTLQILHLPIRAVRLVTDPSVDGFIDALRFIGTLTLAWSELTYQWILRSVGILFGEAAQDRLSRLCGRIDLRPIFVLFVHSGDKDLPASQLNRHVLWSMTGEQFFSHARSFMLRYPTISSFAASVTEGPAFHFAEDRFAALGRQVRLGVNAAWKGWIDIAEGDGTIERLSAIFLGYAIAAFLAALCLNIFTVGNVKSVGRAVRNAIRQQMIVLKVALFIVVELVMFPFGCGTMLDLSTLALFPEATVESRVAFFSYAPITAAFYHWLIGTMFMYQFAILLATCREILRPGCMWFIKDPQDPTFHPIRDILDRPTFAQLQKLFMSAIMYAFVITLGVGCLVWSLAAMIPSMIPLRWKMREPLWDIPVDLLFVHLVLPPTLHYFRPWKAVRRIMTAWWQWSARQLRLTSFMFGGRHPHEEYTPIHWSWATFFRNEEQLVDLESVRDGGFRRVPAGDNIAFLKDKPALVEVDEHGLPLDEDGRAVMWAQNAEAQQAGRNHKDDYTLVYVPPRFRARIFAFIILFWLSGSVAMMSAMFVPILLGRAAFGLFSSRHVHDGYAFAVGFYLLWWGWLVGILMVNLRVRRKRHTGSTRIRAGWFLFLLKRVVVYFAKVTWMVLWLGIVLPTLVSVAVDLYVVIPLRHFFNPNFVPTLHIVESWATGLIISKIIIRTQRTRTGTDLTGALEAIQRNGWRKPDPVAATKDFVVPVGTGLVGMILIPPLILYGCYKIAAPPWPMADLFRLIYPSIFVAVAASQFAMSLVGVFAKWTQGIRDKEFLVELRLSNLENPLKAEQAESTQVEHARKGGEMNEE